METLILKTPVIRWLTAKAESLRPTPLLALAGLMLGLATTPAAAQDVLWARKDGGSAYTNAQGLAVMADGGSVVVGNYSGAPTFGIGNASETTFAHSSQSNYFLARYDSEGVLDFAQPVVTSVYTYGSNVYVTDVAAADDGSFGIAGFVNNSYWYYEQYYGYSGYSQDFEIFGQNGTSQLIESAGSPRAFFVAKYNDQGELLWLKHEVRDYYGSVSALTELPNGGYAVSGEFYGTLTLGDTPLTAIRNDGSYAGTYGRNGFVWAFAADGSDLFSARSAGTGYSVINQIAAAPNGDLLIGGIYDTNNQPPTHYGGGTGVGFGIGEANETILWEGYGRGTFLARLDSSGKVAWAKAMRTLPTNYNYSTFYHTLYLRELNVDDQGGLMFTGYLDGQDVTHLTLDEGLPSETTIATDLRSSYYGYDYSCYCYRYIDYYNADVLGRADAATGAVVWAKNYTQNSGSSPYSYPYGMATKNGKTVLSGQMRGTAVFDADGPQPVTIEAPTYYNENYVAQFDSLSGDLEWVSSIGTVKTCYDYGGGYEYCYYTGYSYMGYRAVGIASNGQVLAAGSFQRAVMFARDTDSELQLNGAYNYNLFLAKYGAGGPSITPIDDITAQCDDTVNRTADVYFTVSVEGSIPAGATLEVTEGGTNNVIESAPASAEVGFGPIVVPLGVARFDVSLVSDGETLLLESFDVMVHDTIAPVLSGVELTYELECQAPSTELFRSMMGISATDNCDIAPEITFSPASLELGTETVTVTARDATGNTTSVSTEITMVDTTAPVFISFPTETIVKECTGVPGTEISFTVEAIDACGAVVIACVDQDGNAVDPNGTLFMMGEHVVTCTATDMVGNESSVEFSVRIEDNTAPVITVPSDISVDNDPGECGAAVSFVVTGTDLCDPNLDVIVTADGAPVSSGDFFPVGTTTVTASATDMSGNAASSSFNITVIDAEPPALVTPADVTLVTDCAGTDLSVGIADLSVSATDNCDTDLAVTCSPSTLSPGTTIVTCMVSDTAGNMSTAQFPVTVMKGAFDYELMNPLDGTADNKIRAGRTVPVKLRVSCDNVFEPNVTASVDKIELLSGGTVVANEVVEDSGLANDEGPYMRLDVDKYIYNLKTSDWDQTKGTRFLVTLRVTKAGHVDTICEFVLVNK